MEYVLVAGLPCLKSVGEDMPNPTDALCARVEENMGVGFTHSEGKGGRWSKGLWDGETSWTAE